MSEEAKAENLRKNPRDTGADYATGPLETLRLAVEQSFDGINITDLDGNILYANPASEQMFGYPHGEMVGIHVSELNIDTEFTRSQIAPSIQSTGSWKGELLQKRRDGSEFIAQISASVVTRNDTPIAMLGIVRDVTRRKEAEEERRRYKDELEKRNAFIQTILDNLPIGLAVNYIDAGKATYINQKFEEIYGWPADELGDVSAFFEKVYPDPEYREYLKERIMADMGSGDPDRMVWKGIEVTDQYGGKKIVDAQNIPIIDQNLMISTVQDVTESVHLQAQLMQAQKMESIGTLAGGIAHDFNNILSSIIGFTELAYDDARKGRANPDFLQEIYKSGLRAKELIRQILAFARQNDTSKRPTNISKVVREVIKFLRSTVPAEITIDQDIQSKSYVLGNHVQFYQIFLNLCTNAYQAIGNKEGEIRVSVRDVSSADVENAKMIGLEAGRYVEIKVADNGEGIPADIINNIFEPYFTTKAIGEGTGLGLSVAHGIVESYSGKIFADSKSGEGSVFTVLLPINQDEHARESALPGLMPGGSERILLVDDEIGITRMGKNSLERLGYTVETCNRSIEALRIISENQDAFDLVITDMSMPEMRGDQLALEVLKIRPDMPIILCTGYSKSINEKTIAEIGVKAVALKPIVKADLARMVRQVLDEAKHRPPEPA